MKAEHLRAQLWPNSTDSQQLPLMKSWVSRGAWEGRRSSVQLVLCPFSPVHTGPACLSAFPLHPTRLPLLSKYTWCSLTHTTQVRLLQPPPLFPPLSFWNRVLLYAPSDLVLTVQLKLASNSYYSCLNLLSAGSTGCTTSLAFFSFKSPSLAALSTMRLFSPPDSPVTVLFCSPPSPRALLHPRGRGYASNSSAWGAEAGGFSSSRIARATQRTRLEKQISSYFNFY